MYAGKYIARADIEGTPVSKTFTVDKTAQVIVLSPNSADARLTGTVVDSITNTPLADVSVIAKQGDQDVSSSRTDPSGAFSVDLPAGSCRLEISKNGYASAACYEEVTDGEIKDVGTIRLVSGSGKGGFSGQITDDTTGDPVEGVTLKLRAGWNNSSNGDVLRTLTTDSNGRFEYSMVKIGNFIIHGLDAGNYTLTASKAGYSTSSFNVVVYPDMITLNQDASISPGADIPNDAVYYNGHMYKIYDQSMTWIDAQAYCELLGGNLVTVTDLQENDFIVSLINGVSSPRNCYWIGLTWDNTNLEWTWVTGEHFYYTNWAPNEPNNDQGNAENYVHLFGKVYTGGRGIKNVGQWNDALNEGAPYANDYYSLGNFGYICEWDYYQ